MQAAARLLAALWQTWQSCLGINVIHSGVTLVDRLQYLKETQPLGSIILRVHGDPFRGHNTRDSV